jgi:hypothetical protein
MNAACSCVMMPEGGTYREHCYALLKAWNDAKPKRVLDGVIIVIDCQQRKGQIHGHDAVPWASHSTFVEESERARECRADEQEWKSNRGEQGLNEDHG